MLQAYANNTLRCPISHPFLSLLGKITFEKIPLELKMQVRRIYIITYKAILSFQHLT